MFCEVSKLLLLAGEDIYLLANNYRSSELDGTCTVIMSELVKYPTIYNNVQLGKLQTGVSHAHCTTPSYLVLVSLFSVLQDV
jgi:hypothetical protein